jgi:hypothetical protein
MGLPWQYCMPLYPALPLCSHAAYWRQLSCWLLLMLSWPGQCLAQPAGPRTENVILVTLDGMRWQEIFEGADARRFSPAEQRPVAPTAQQRRQELLPFLWSTVATQGQLYGNRAYGNRVNVANNKHFSYPGYHELLTGFPNPRIHSNAPADNPYPSVLAYLSRLPGYQGRVATFASWEVLRPILHAPGSDFYVNAGWQPALGPRLSAREQQLNTYLRACARPFAQERSDTLTFAYAFEYLKREQPRVLYLSFGDTDELGHQHRYADYLHAAHSVDACLARLWAYVQATPAYRDKTTLLITTDHGRGKGRWWHGHGLQVPGSGQTWLAVLGPDTSPTGEQRSRGQYYQKQVAQTLAQLLGVSYWSEHPSGLTIESILPAYPKAPKLADALLPPAGSE